MADTQPHTKTKGYSAVSAPGKVLLAGGYLVLDRAYTGLVFGLSARIHVIVQDAATTTTSEGEGAEPLIVVRSPQFVDAEWRYSTAVLGDGAGVAVKQLESPSTSRNPFVETTLTYTLSYLLTTGLTHLPSLTITILADNDYYSQPTSTTSSTTTPSTPFTTFPTPLPLAHKTGLGSSAALTTSLTTSLLTHLLPSPPPSPLSHNLSQSAHCAAQGKIGSGFDVAAAVHGSCLYRRFSPALLAPISDGSGPGSKGFVERLRSVVEEEEQKWDTLVEKGVVIPDGYALVMCDVDCGSQTVGMVKSVLAWRAASPGDASRLWTSLQSANEELARALSAGAESEISSAFKAIRALIREMGDKAGVPIEPPAQTELLDALEKVEGVVGGVVPGAGGHDAVALLVRGGEETLGRVRGMLGEWSGRGEGR
ncbi:phosphomevalonate kinase [Pseudogymnoascus australis]